MNEERRGGAAVWAPKTMAGVGRELTAEQQLACALRHLDDLGFCENLTGHITWQLPGETNLRVNPWGIWWAETKASDILTITPAGEVVAGKWDVTPAFHIHTELHRRRPDARVVVHNHPMHVTILAGLGVLPEIIHQNSAMFFDEMVFVNEYDGEVDSAQLGGELAERMGDASVALLASHGVVITAPTIEEATYKSALFERCCEIHYKTMLTGRDPFPIAPEHLKPMKASLIERAAQAYWDGAVRQLLAREPDVLD
ncbi:MAG TPA: class II aldolase/adducin family protein [Acidimicrobiales bacterium]|jgi:ribulose-5-phosphate 4-epimerase/fuculose-1-phosphate aldolase|nr:class II aldolase/adducin family protein [Acidimicrobiales bacterium]